MADNIFWALFGMILGVLFILTFSYNFGSEVVRTDLLNNICKSFYGEDSYWVDRWFAEKIMDCGCPEGLPKVIRIISSEPKRIGVFFNNTSYYDGNINNTLELTDFPRNIGQLFVIKYDYNENVYILGCKEEREIYI